MNSLAALRYAIEEVSDNYDDPLWWRGRLAQRLVAPVHQRYHGRDGVDVMEASWDTLVVLDGCRADLFRAVADTSDADHSQQVVSRGSMTREWIQENFAGGRFGDTVYVTANPYVSRIAGDAFHDVVEVWADDFDSDARTVLPEDVAAAVRTARDNYPDKRLVAHFMQPHYPFLDHPELTFKSWEPDHMHAGDDGHTGRGPHNVWQALELGLVNHETVWDAYADNLKRVLDVALPLVSELDGRTVVTSDHGNMLGERAWPVPLRIFGHPPAVRAPELVEVPWVVYDGDRRDVTDEGARDTTAPGEDVEARLRDLGYA